MNINFVSHPEEFNWFLSLFDNVFSVAYVIWH
jgi:hypothetical protein